MLKTVGNLSLGLSLLTATLVFSGPAMAQGHEHGGSLSARQHGYEHGYRDGYHQGREDRARGASRDYDRSKDYKEADRGYESYMGKKGDFKKGYHEGYALGYSDGYDGRPGRFAEIYGLGTRVDPDAPYVDDRDDIYVRRGYGVSDVAFDIGYRDGIEAGRSDRAGDRSFNMEAHGRFREALHGYDTRYGDQETYRRLYRQGYTAGYRDSYGGR